MSRVFRFSMTLFAGVFALVMVSCGGASTTSTTTTTTSSADAATVSSLDEIPEMTSMVTAAAEAASRNALFAVSGTAPNLVDITASTADTLFWDGLIAELGQRSAVESDLDDFWTGEAKCRSAQMVGYSFQEIGTSGGSLCYMKNMPQVTTGGVEITQGEIDDATTLFDAEETTKVVRVEVSGGGGGEGEGEGGGDQDVYIRVYGTGTDEGSSGYAVDLWFCPDGSSDPDGYEEIRYNETSGVITQTSMSQRSDGQEGQYTFTNAFTGYLVEDTDGNITFDTDQEQSALVFFSSSNFSSKALISVDGETMDSKEWGTDSFGDQTNERKTFARSTFTGTSLDAFKILTSGFTTQWSNGDNDADRYFGAMEFQDTLYADLNEGSLYDAVESFSFADDSFWSGTLAQDSTVTDALDDYDCSATVDYVVAMDFSDSGVQAVGATCENEFSDMNFCDAEAVQQARESIFSVEFSGGGE